MIAGLKPYPVIKDSGVEQLGKVPEHWNVCELGRVGSFFKGNGVPCVRYGDLYTRHRYYIERAKSCVSQERAVAFTPIRFGDVLFAGSGEAIEEIGKSAVNLLDEPACCGGDVIVFRPSIDLEPRFLGLATDCPQAAYQKSCMGRGITVMHIYGSELKYLSIALPPAAEQAAIVRYLDHVDRQVRRLVRAKRKLIALLTEQKNVIIHRAVTRGLEPDVHLKDSGVEWLGEVPAHWVVARLRDVALVQTGITLGKNYKDIETTSYPYLRVANVQIGRLDLSQVKQNDVPSSEAIGATLRAGDALMTEGGDINNNAIARAEREISLLTECRTRLTAYVVTGKLDVREAAAALPEVEPLAADDEPDTLDAESETGLDDLDAIPEEAAA